MDFKPWCGQLALALSFFLVRQSLSAADYPPPNEGDYVLQHFHFASGEELPELRIHFRTFGKAELDSSGRTTNAILILHGTTGSGNQFIRPEFAGELFGAGKLLDSQHYFLILPTELVTDNRANPATACMDSFPDTGTRTWLTRSSDF
jgi:homoserine O-acetyltransferase